MNDFKGSKGKWVVGVANMKDTNRNELVVSIEGGEKVKEGYRLVACISPFDKMDEIDLANALLVSKSPEMLEMLQLLVVTFKDNPNLELYEITRLSRAEQLIKEATEL